MNFGKFLFLCLLSLFMFTLYADIDDNWEAYYAFENGMEDSITASSGSLVNGATISSGMSGDSLFLDGTNDYANLRVFDPSSGGYEFSISFWTRSNDSSQGNHCYIGKHSSTGGNEFLIGFWSGQFSVQVMDDYERVTTTETLGSWIHWVVTVKNQPNWEASYVTVYKNSTQIAYFILDRWFTFNGGKAWVVGQDWDGTSTPSDFFTGGVDDIRFFSSLLTSADVTALYYRRYGFPNYLDTYTMSVEYYEGEGNDLPYSHNHKWEFLNALTNSLDVEDYDDTIGQTQRANLEDTYVTEASMESSATDEAEIVYFAGHGANGGYGPVSYDGNAMNPSEKAYSGYTKWVIYDACQTLRLGGSYVDDAFNGNHVIFGNHSNSTQFKLWNLSTGWEYSDEMPKDFMNTWIQDKEPMYEAWIDAIDDQWAEEGIEIKSGAIQRRATIDGKYFSGNYQRIYDTYKLSLNTGTFWENFVTWGTPGY